MPLFTCARALSLFKGILGNVDVMMLAVSRPDMVSADCRNSTD